MRDLTSAGGERVALGPDGEGTLRIRRFAGGPFQENAYLLECATTGRAAVVDPGYAADGMAEAIRQEGLEVEAIYLTHAHLDHVEGIPAVRRVTGAPIFLHPDDRFLYDRAPAQAQAFGYRLEGDLPPVDRDLQPGSRVRVGEVELEVRFAPGHAPGHVIFHAPPEKVALVGDVIFHRSIGRTDLPGGDFQRLIRSIRTQILTLPDDTLLLTGHGPDTRVGEERRGNPFLIPQTRGDEGLFA
jgi:hydroxyacylglutathione hydrolase